MQDQNPSHPSPIPPPNPNLLFEGNLETCPACGGAMLRQCPCCGGPACARCYPSHYAEILEELQLTRQELNQTIDQLTQAQSANIRLRTKSQRIERQALETEAAAELALLEGVQQNATLRQTILDLKQQLAKNQLLEN